MTDFNAADSMLESNLFGIDAELHQIMAMLDTDSNPVHIRVYNKLQRACKGIIAARVELAKRRRRTDDRQLVIPEPSPAVTALKQQQAVPVELACVKPKDEK